MYEDSSWKQVIAKGIAVYALGLAMVLVGIYFTDRNSMGFVIFSAIVIPVILGVISIPMIIVLKLTTGREQQGDDTEELENELDF